MNTLIISPVLDKNPRTNLWDWDRQLLSPDCTSEPVLQDGLSPHDRSRSYLASRALDTDEFPGIDAFLWVDDDMDVTLEQAKALVSTMEEDGADLVTGVYVCRHAASRGELALNFNLRFLENEAGMKVSLGPTGDCHPIIACGFGFVLTHRRIFERMAPRVSPATYTANDGGAYDGYAFFLPLVQYRTHLGEDRSFCARNQNARMLVNTRVCVGHAGHTVESVMEAMKEKAAANMVARL